MVTMRRLRTRAAIGLTLILVLWFGALIPVHGQTFSAQIQQFWNQLRTGVLVFTNLRATGGTITGVAITSANPTFTGQLTVTGAVLTGASTPVASFTQTWNNGATTFEGFRISITDTASGANSLPFAIRDNVDGTGIVFKVFKDGSVSGLGTIQSVGNNQVTNSGAGYIAPANGYFHWLNQSYINSPTDGTYKFGSNAFTQGFVFDTTTTADTLRVMNFANNADGNVRGATLNATTKIQPGSFVFANIATVLTTNGDMAYCSDCTIANPCANAGTGSFAKRLNGVNVCN